jgi:hypothetical protein
VYGPLILRFSSCHNTWFPSTTCCVSFLQIRLPKAHIRLSGFEGAAKFALGSETASAGN